MPIEQGVCVSYKSEVLSGVHTPSDDYKIALYDHDANLDCYASSYTTQCECFGDGYFPGGKKLSGFNIVVNGKSVGVGFDSVTWDNTTITARCAMVYNATRDNRSVCIIDFGDDKTSTNGPFSVFMPKSGILFSWK